MSFRISSLPTKATAPFCPSEVKGSIEIPPHLTGWKRLLAFCGPGLLISVGYVDPGNWATDIAAGSAFGFNLLFVVMLASLSAMFLQCLSMRVGIVTQRDLAQLSRQTYHPVVNFILWILAELAIIATDVAEVLGCALAFHLLLGCPLSIGILITALDTLIVLGLKGRGFRMVEAIILGLLLTIGLCFIAEIWIIQPYWPEVMQGFIPALDRLADQNALYLAIGIIGATVMPHNIYLHSSIVQTRQVAQNDASMQNALKMNTFDTVASLSFAFIINAAILILAASAFHNTGNTGVNDIEQAHALLNPIAGTGLAPILFALALLAAGQSSTFTGTIAGQVILEGYLNIKIPCWQRRLISRALALIPALVGILIFGDSATGDLLVLSQVVLGLQLPFTIFPLIRFCSNRDLMGRFRIGLVPQSLAWILFSLLTACNLWLIGLMISR